MAYLPVSEEPLVYILGPDSMLFDFRGAYTLIDSGDSAVTLTKHIRQVNCLLTPAPSDKTVQNALFQNKNRLVPVVGSVIGKELNHRLGEQGIPAILAKQSDKYEPIVLYKSLAEGRLELFVLDGGQKPSLEALQKALDKGDSTALEGAAEKFGMIFVLVWYPAKLNEKVRRILYTGNASTERVVLALEKASSLTLLQTPSATTGQANAGIAPPPKNKVTSARPNGAPPTRTAAAPRPAPTRAPAPAKPATARGPAKEVLKPPPTNLTARPARPSTTTSTTSSARSAKPAAPTARTSAPPARKAPEPAAVKKTAAPLRGALASKPTVPAAAAKKPEPKKVDQKGPAPAKPKEAPKEDPKTVPKPAEHVHPVVPPQPPVDTPLVTIADEPSRPTDQSSFVPIVSEPGSHELAPEVRVIPATPEPPHRDDDDHRPPVPEHQTVVHPAPEEPEPDHQKDKPFEPAPAEPAPGFNEPHVPQPANNNGLLDDVEEPMIFRRISMDTDLTDEEAQKFVEQFEQKTKLDENGHLSDQQKSALDDLLSGIPLDSNQLVDAAIAASLSQTLSGEPNEFYTQHPDNQKQDPITNGGHHEEEAADKMRVMQTRASVVEAGEDNKVYEEPDKALDDILSHVTDQSEEVDRKQSQDNDGFKPVDFNELPPQPMHMVLNKIKPSLKNDRYFELVTVPHKAGKCTLENLDEARDFFRTIRSTVYVLASEDIQQFVLDGWLEGKKAWHKSDAPSSLYPSVSTPAIQAFTTAHRSDLEQEHMTIHPSIANTNLLIQADEGPEEFKTAKLLL